MRHGGQRHRAPRIAAAETCGSVASSISSSGIMRTLGAGHVLLEHARSRRWRRRASGSGRSTVGVEAGQEVLAQQRLRVLLPGGVQQQRHVVAGRPATCRGPRARPAGGRRCAAPSASSLPVDAVVGGRDAEPHDLAVLRAGSRPSRRPSTRASAARGRCRRSGRSCVATAGAGCRRRPRPARRPARAPPTGRSSVPACSSALVTISLTSRTQAVDQVLAVGLGEQVDGSDGVGPRRRFGRPRLQPHVERSRCRSPAAGD